MNIRQRLLAIKLSESIKKNPKLARELGIEVKFKINEKEKGEMICLKGDI